MIQDVPGQTLSEQEKVADKAAAQTKEKTDQEAKAKRDSIKTALSDFLGRGQRLTGRTLDAADATVENDANAWMNEASLYVRDNLGVDRLARMNTDAGVTGFMPHAPTPARQSLHFNVYIRVLRLQEFLRELA